MDKQGSNFLWLGPSTVLPQIGEIDANIMDFEEVYGLKFGAVGVIERNFGGSVDKFGKDNPPVFCISVPTYGKTETLVGFYRSMGRFVRDAGGKWQITASRKPWSRVGDDGVFLSEGHDLGITYADERPTLMSYLSKDGEKDPRKGATKHVRRGMTITRVEVPPRPDNTGYPAWDRVFVTFRRIDFPDSATHYPVTKLTYKGTDDTEHGGEALIEQVETPVTPAEPDIAGGGTGVEVTGGGTGIELDDEVVAAHPELAMGLEVAMELLALSFMHATKDQGENSG